MGFMGGKVMEIVLVIIAISIVCAAVFLKRKAWSTFADDVTSKDKSRMKNSSGHIECYS